MGQKINPISMRLGINRTWDSRWYASKQSYASNLMEDKKIRDFLNKRLKGASVSKITIERPATKCRIFIHTARPGVIIGKKGQDIETLKKELSKISNAEIYVNIVEIRKPDIDAQLVAENIASQIERRIAFRRAMKRAVQNATAQNIAGIRINAAGRLGGTDIARTEWYREGNMPLHTLRSDIDYGYARAQDAYGIIGIKVWLNHGEKIAIDGDETGTAQ